MSLSLGKPFLPYFQVAFPMWVIHISVTCWPTQVKYSYDWAQSPQGYAKLAFKCTNMFGLVLEVLEMFEVGTQSYLLLSHMPSKWMEICIQKTHSGLKLEMKLKKCSKASRPCNHDNVTLSASGTIPNECELQIGSWIYYENRMIIHSQTENN